MQTSTDKNIQQQLPQHAIKVKKQKQQTIIRKITIQSIGPVIQKVEEHIGYLLNQTKLQRERNQQLAIAFADHNLLRSRMEANEAMIQKVREQFAELIDQRKNDLIGNQKGVQLLKTQLNTLRNDLKHKQKKIKELQGNVGNNIKIQRQDKQALSDLIEQMNRKIAETQQSSTTIGNKNTNNFNALEQRTKKNDSLIRQTKMLFEQSNRVIQLFLNQRQPAKAQMQKVWERIHRTVEKSQYQKDRMAIKAENQILRKNVKNMIDSALTPDVRSFLPVMLDKMQQIQRLPLIQQTLNSTVQTLNSAVETLKQDKIHLKFIDQTIEKHKQQNIKQFHENDHKFDLLRLKIQQNLQKIKKNQTGIEDSNERIESLKDQLKFNLFEANQSLQKVQIKLISNIQESRALLNNRINSLVQDRKQQIYDVVTQLVPQETKQFNKYLKEFLPSFQQTKQTIIQRCDKVQQLGNFLKKQIQSFNFKFTKIKGDTKLQISKAIQQLKGTNARIDLQQKNIKTLGGFLSDIMEILLTSLASGTPNYDQQVYVTYNDGIVLQSDASLKPGELVYRRKKMIRQDLRKCLLTSAIQLIDHAIKHESLSFVDWQKCKPSRFFYNHIFKNYQKIEEGRIRKVKFNDQNDKAQTARPDDHLSADNSFKMDMSKTIQPIRSTGHRRVPSKSMANDPKKSFNLKLKKLENQRYSSLNKTIDKQQ